MPARRRKEIPRQAPSNPPGRAGELEAAGVGSAARAAGEKGPQDTRGRNPVAARAAPKHDFKDTDFGSIEGFVCMMCDPTLKVLYAHRQMLEEEKPSGVDTGDMEEC